MLKASIDLGTNTCLLLIAEMRGEVVSEIIGDYSTMVRLGEGVDQKRELQSAPMERVIKCLKDYSEKVKAAGLTPPDVVGVATSQARDAKNSAEFFSRVQKETGFQFRTLSGDEEAHFTFLGALLPKMEPSQTTVIDIGGGSTEITTLKGGQSVDIGSVRLRERFLKADPVSASEFAACQKEIDQALQVFELENQDWSKVSSFVGVAGTLTTLAQWQLDLPKFDREKIDSMVLTSEQVGQMIQKLKELSIAQRAQIPAIGPDRADVILPGAMILLSAMRTLGFEKCQVSTRGLRFGVLTLCGIKHKNT